MHIDTVKMMIETRLAVAKQNGNGTEASLMWELLKLANEKKEKLESENNKGTD